MKINKGSVFRTLPKRLNMDYSKNLLDMLKKADLTEEQYEQIIGGFVEGLSEGQVMECFYMEPEKMRQMRMYFRQKNSF